MPSRLAAIMAMDMVGYSSQMAEDEAGTLARLKQVISDLIEPAIADHTGRVFKVAGDAILAEFASAISAVDCAANIQRAIKQRTVLGNSDRATEFRIGINLGEVIIDDGDVFGDAVNIAARLEQIAPEGGVGIASIVHEQVAGKVEPVFVPAGKKQVKNITRPIEVWTWTVPDIPESAAGPERLSLIERPSLAVLPFTTLSDDSQLDFLADGFTEDLITAFSHIKELFVIAHNSSSVFKGQSPDGNKIEQALGVRYVVEGSIRPRASDLRVNALLIDVTTGRHLWAETFRSSSEDFLESSQDEIVRNIVASSQTQIILHEGEAATRRPGETPSVHRLIKRAWAEVYRLTRDSHLEARRLAMEALREAPNSDRPYQVLACVGHHLCYQGYAEDWSDTLEQAFNDALRALEIYEADEYSHWVLGCLWFDKRDTGRAVQEIVRSIEINPNFSLGYGSLGAALAWAGKSEESIRNCEIALRANPRDPSNFFRFFSLAVAHFTAGRIEEAKTWVEKAVQRKKTFRPAHLLHVSASGLLENRNSAHSAVTEFRRHFPELRPDHLEQVPFVRTEDRAIFERGLEMAGLSWR